MAMPVTDQQFAAVHALLAGDVEKHKRLLAQLDRDKDKIGFSALIGAGFFEAVDRRFVKNGKTAETAHRVRQRGAHSIRSDRR
jgi:hypothetical protein